MKQFLWLNCNTNKSDIGWGTQMNTFYRIDEFLESDFHLLWLRLNQCSYWYMYWSYCDQAWRRTVSQPVQVKPDPGKMRKMCRQDQKRMFGRSREYNTRSWLIWYINLYRSLINVIFRCKIACKMDKILVFPTYQASLHQIEFSRVTAVVRWFHSNIFGKAMEKFETPENQWQTGSTAEYTVEWTTDGLQTLSFWVRIVRFEDY